MRRLRALVFIFTLAAAPWRVTPIARAAPPDPGHKVSAWVAANTAYGKSAEFLVVLVEQANLGGAGLRSTRRERGRYVFDMLRRTAQAAQRPLLAWLTANNIPHRAFYIVNLVWVRGDASLVQALAARPDVARLDGNPRIAGSDRQALAGPPGRAAAPAGIEASLAYVHAPDVWALGYTGQGLVIGGQDTGYQWDHPALKPHYRGWDGTTVDHNYHWHDSIHVDNGDCAGDSPAPCDDYGHGTHTLGTALGSDGGSNQIGMAPGAQWIGCRNMNNGFGTPASYLECFEWFLAPYALGDVPANGNPSLAPDITNNSWSCPPSEGCAADTLRLALEAQRAAGIFTVVSAGNTGPGCSTIGAPPAFYDAAYTVGALNPLTDTIAAISSRGPVTADGSQRTKPDIAAPGLNIRSSVPVNGYATMNGTSMAVPHVAGAVALLWSARPAARGQIELTETILNQAAFHIDSDACGSSGWPNNAYGYGRLDVLAAVNSLPAETGTLAGGITEKFSGTPVSNALLRATSVTTPTFTLALASDTVGGYSQILFPGSYTVTVTPPFRASVTLTGVTVLSGTLTTLNVEVDPIHIFPLFFKSSVP